MGNDGLGGGIPPPGPAPVGLGGGGGRGRGRGRGGPPPPVGGLGAAAGIARFGLYNPRDPAWLAFLGGDAGPLRGRMGDDNHSSEARARQLCHSNSIDNRNATRDLEEYAKDQHDTAKAQFGQNVDGKVTNKMKMDSRYVLTVKNFPDVPFRHIPTYKDYQDWEMRGEYWSNQFAAPLQQRLLEKAIKETNGRFFNMSTQSQLEMRPQETMPLFPLDFEKDILDDFTVLFIGRRRSGKSFGARYLMYHLRHRFPFGVVITGTRLNNYWAKYVPQEYIHDIQDMNQILDFVFARQTLLTQYPELGIDRRMFLILDDVMEDKFFIRYNAALSKVFTNGRHFGIFLVIISQDVKGIPPDLRENTDCAIIFRIFEGERQKIADREWLSYFDQTEDFLWSNTGLMNKTTLESFQETNETTDTERIEEAMPQAVAILRGRVTENLQASVRRFAAEDPGPFELGSHAYWKAGCSGNYKAAMHTFDLLLDEKRKKPPKHKVPKYVQNK